jgi:hypothetical protein
MKCKPQQQRVRQLLSTPMLSLLSTLWLQGEVVAGHYPPALETLPLVAVLEDF